MSTTPKIFLTVSVTTFALSFAPFFTDLGWGILKPVAAVAFILFAIAQFLAKEMALYDEELRAHDATLPGKNETTPAPAGNRGYASSRPTLAR